MLENTKMDNTLVWADIPTRDLDRAMAFYAALLDIEVTPVQEEIRFAMLRHDGNNAAACLGPMDEYHQPGGLGPLIYLSLGDRLREAERMVPRLGGRVLEPLHSIGSGHGSRVIIEDTEGNRLALYAPPAA
ncbi:MAG: VOC family protein [Aeromonas sp.]|uniref:VOC family protein n=1 Tax=Aeromonas sp. TaxID=647 RepID=UPI002FC657B7